MASRQIRVALAALGMAFVAAGSASARELTFRDRVAAQRAIEQVYWNHRIWPEVNRTPKPRLDALLPEDALSARVLRVLKLSESVTGEQLQAEMERMTRTTRAPQVLRELFAALGNDPELIAETLARATLVERLSAGEFGTATRERETAPPEGGYSLPAIPVAVDALCHGENWRSTLTDLPSGRREVVAVWTGTEMIVWGGNSGKRENTGGRYNPATDTWTATAITPATPSARIRSSAVWTGTEMIVWGGWTGQAPLATGGRYNPTTDTWTATSTGAGTPSARERNSAVWTGSEMIVWGGYDGSTNTYVNTGGRYSPASDTWTATATTSGNPTARREHTAVWTGGVMVVWGGYSGTAAVNTGSRYNPTTNTWAATATSATAAARYLHTGVWNGSVMIVWGGYNGTTWLNTGSRYNPASNTWTATATTAGVPPAVYIHTAVWTGTEMIVWGGYSSTGPVNTGGRYNPTTNTWTATAISPTATARGEHAAVWTGSEMLVWGGSDGTALATGSRYNPTSDTWIATSMGSGVPLARFWHTAIWTGAEMLVWGGQGLGSNVYLNTGGRYDPATDVWTATPTSGAPSVRRLHTAVWTGTEMIVWGGAGISQLDDGGRFNPTTGSWAPMAASTGVVDARTSHSAVWTGTEMIVWGGADVTGTSYSNTGGRYDPAGDGWTATSIGSGVPAPRTGHSAIWTGAEMIVWGGNDASTAFAAGGRYEPSTDSWSLVASAGEPSGRRNHTAVWTGSRMIVWGGDAGGSTLFDTGGLYDPSMDSWQATAQTDAPFQRNSHSAVWTGTQMIVWGGSLALYDTGGRYDPSANAWMATTTAGAPPGRRLHTAVWTGDAMIVFGGYDVNATNTGGRYQLDTNGAACDDGDACTGADVCSGSTCQGQTLSVPAEVTGLVAQSDRQTFAWNPATSSGPGTVHDVLRGESLPVGGGAEVCLSPGIAAAQTVDATTPPPGTEFWYLVRARNSCGFGSYGTRSNGTPRLSNACP